MIDLGSVARNYLKSLGLYDVKKKIGDIEVWYRREKQRIVAAGPSEKSVTPSNASAPEASSASPEAIKKK